MRKNPLNLDAPARATRPFDPSQTLASGAQRAIENAQELARVVGNQRVESVHLLLGALQIEPPDAQLGALLQISELKAEEVRLYAQSALEHAPSLATDALPRLSESAKLTLQLAGKEARRTNCALVDISHIFVACFRAQNASQLAEVLAPLGVSPDQLSLHLRQLARGETAKEIQNESPLAQLTVHGERALEAAHAAMRARFCGRISTLHLLIGVLENPDSEAVAALQTVMIDVAELKQRADVAASGDGEIAGPNRRFTPAAKRALDRAKAAARDGGRNHIGSADLLLGLLPQPTLLIERAQFGAQPDDPAAALLRDVNADLVRAIFNPQQAAMAPAKPLQRKAIYQSPALLVFVLQIVSGCVIQVMATNRSVTAIAALAIIAVLIISALFAIVMLLSSRTPERKTAALYTFFGALAGAFLAMIIASRN